MLSAGLLLFGMGFVMQVTSVREFTHSVACPLLLIKIKALSINRKDGIGIMIRLKSSLNSIVPRSPKIISSLISTVEGK